MREYEQKPYLSLQSAPVRVATSEMRYPISALLKPCLFILYILFSIFLSITFFIPLSLAGDNTKESTESLSHLKKGKELFEKGKYEAALVDLKIAYDESPVIRDYTLFFMARAYNGLEGFDDSSNCVNKILKDYPDSLLRKRVRAFQLNNVIRVSEVTPPKKRFSGKPDYDAMLFEKSDAALKLLESYAADYPDDAEMAFRLGRLLKQLGNSERAKKIFIRIYTGDSPYAESAYQELQPSDIKPDDMLAKASNLIKEFEYKRAETILRKTLAVAGDSQRDGIYRKLGMTLFKQKKYTEASDAFSKAGDLYDSARSFFRAGDLNAFNEEVSKLVSMEDKRAGSLLVAYASKKRREGKVEEALSIYNDVKKRYPSLSEDVLWGIAWTYYRSSDYKKALDLFTELNERYPSSRYLYWKQRCIEGDSSNKISPEVQRKMKGSPKDFYSLLTQMREKENLSGRPVKQAAWTPETRHSSLSNLHLPQDIRTSLERFTILNELDMKEDAFAELIHAANGVSRPDVLLYLCRILQEAGAYKRSINLISGFSEDRLNEPGDGMNINEILYPLAYWQIVSEAANRYMLDPFILLSVIREESRFDPRARSAAGALGLMQIMPHTAYNLDKKLKFDISGNDEIYNIKTNITIGAYYLNSLLKEFGSLPVALAAYNAGHDKIGEWIKEGNYKSYDEFIEDIPYDETRNYVKRVLLTYATYLDLGSKQ